MLGSRVPASSYREFDEGEHCDDAQAGDLILVEHNGLLPAIIRIGQRLSCARKRLFGQKQFLAEYCAFNHAAVVVAGGPKAILVEMAAKGGQATALHEYVARRYVVISLEATEAQKHAAVDFANYCLQIKYGWLSIVGIVFDIILGWNIVLGSTERLICSAAASLSARCMGLIPDCSDPAVMPADHARYFQIHPRKD